MNSFHNFSTFIGNKDKISAMLVLRDKSEFVARKILEKSRIRVPSLTGRLFWKWVQDYISTACQPSGEINYSGSVENAKTDTHGVNVRGDDEPRRDRPGKGVCTDGHVSRPPQHPVSGSSVSGTVCAGPDGVPGVCHHLGEEPQPQSGIAADPGHADVDVGAHRPAGVLAGVPASTALVCPEYSVCVRRRDAAGRARSPLRVHRHADRHPSAAHPGVPPAPGELRRDGPRFHLCGGGRLFPARAGCHIQENRHDYRRRRVVLSERYHPSCRASPGYAGYRGPAGSGAARYGDLAGRPAETRRFTPLYARAVFLPRVCRSSVATCPVPDLPPVMRPGRGVGSHAAVFLCPSGQGRRLSVAFKR